MIFSCGVERVCEDKDRGVAARTWLEDSRRVSHHDTRARHAHAAAARNRTESLVRPRTDRDPPARTDVATEALVPKPPPREASVKRLKEKARE